MTKQFTLETPIYEGEMGAIASLVKQTKIASDYQKTFLIHAIAAIFCFFKDLEKEGKVFDLKQISIADVIEVL